MLKGTGNPYDYEEWGDPAVTGTKQRPFLRIEGQSNVTIGGRGYLDIQGQQMRDTYGTTDNDSIARRILAIDMKDCYNVVIDGITVRNASNWHIHPYFSDYVSIKNVKLLTGHLSSQKGWTDGIDPDSARYVVVDNCLYTGGDDGVSLKVRDKFGRDRSMYHITVKNSVFFAKFRGVVIGDELENYVDDVTFENVDVLNNQDEAIFGIKTEAFQGQVGGEVHDIRYFNVHAEDWVTPNGTAEEPFDAFDFEIRQNQSGDVREIFVADSVVHTGDTSEVYSFSSTRPLTDVLFLNTTFDGSVATNAAQANATLTNTSGVNFTATNNNPIGSWRFEYNGANTGADGPDATFPNGSGYTTRDLKEGGYALLLDGADQYVALNEPVATGGFLRDAFSARSMSFWFKANAVSGKQMLLDEGGKTNGMAVRLDGSTLEAAVANGGSVKKTSHNGIAAGKWHHVAATFDSGDLKLYVDGGLPRDSLATGFSSIPQHDNASAVGATSYNDAFGDNPGSAGANFYNGLIDDVRIFGRVLSTTEVDQLSRKNPYADAVSAEDFETTSIGSDPTNWTESSGDWSVQSSGGGRIYRQAGTGNVGAHATFDDFEEADARLLGRFKVNATQSGTGFIWFALRWEDNDNYVQVGYDNSAGQWVIREKVSGSTNVLASSNASLNLGSWHEVEIEVIGTQAALFVDNNPVPSVKTNALSKLGSGRLALYSSRAETDFDELLIEEY